MKKLCRRIHLIFAFALGLSIGLPAGILGIIFGATKDWIALLVIGIILTVAGFYGMPLLWVAYGSRRQDRALLFLIENEGLLSVEDLAQQTGLAAKDVQARLRTMVVAGFLTGYLLRDDGLVCNRTARQKPRHPLHKPCQSCGANMHLEEDIYICDYCGSRENA